jgi:hypothetical protein
MRVIRGLVSCRPVPMRDLDPFAGIILCGAACLAFWLVVLAFYWL